MPPSGIEENVIPTVPQLPVANEAGSITTLPLVVAVGLSCVATVPSPVLTEEIIHGQGILKSILFTGEPELLQRVHVAV